MNQQTRSEGELFLESFFRNNKIKFQAEKAIRNLKADSHEYRVADFYLPRFDIYVEFQGLWNNSKGDRERYKDKMRTYSKNGVPCVYLYPENLGTIEYTFHARMLKILKQNQMKSQLFKYKFFRFVNQKRNTLLWFAFFLYSGIINHNAFMQAPEGSFEESVFAMVYVILFVQIIILSVAAFRYIVKEL